MNVFVRLAVLVATFLMITNMAFAQPVPCDQVVCYNTTSTFSNGSTSSVTYGVCLNNNATGFMLPIEGDSVSFIPLMLFGGSPFSAGFDLTPGWSTWIIDSLVSPIIIDAPLNPMQGYFWTSADGIYLFGQGTKGITIPDETYYSSESTPLRLRWILKGAKVPCPI